MPGSHLFNLGLFQKKFNSTSKVTGPAINLGCTRGRGSTTRMFNYCNKRTANPSLCMNQFITIQKPSISSSGLYTSPSGEPKVCLYLYSKNNTTDNGFLVGEELYKDMVYINYKITIDPVNYQTIFFPDMAEFVDSNIVVGDKSSDDRLISSYWVDWGDDVFDNWGFIYLYDVESGKYYFPLISPKNEVNGNIITQTFNTFGRTFTIKQGYPVQGIFKFDISVNDDKPFKFGIYGNVGSDDSTYNENLTYPYTINNTNLTLYYLHNLQIGKPVEQFYVYFIPKLAIKNNSKTYDAYYTNNTYNNNMSYDNNNTMSKVITNGLIVYISKTNDVKEWVVNDLGLQNS